MFTLNQVIETLAPVIAQKNDYRAVIEYTNGDTILLDFSACGEPYTDGNVMVWSYQRERLDENGKWCGTDEVDYGTFVDYLPAFRFIESSLNAEGYTVKDFYMESF